MRRSSTSIALLAAGTGLLAAAGPARADIVVDPKCHVPAAEDKNQLIQVPFTATKLGPGSTQNVVVTAPGVGPKASGTSAPLSIGPIPDHGNAEGTLAVENDFKDTPSAGVPGTIAVVGADNQPLFTAPVLLGSVALKIGSGKAKKVTQKINWEVSGLSVLTGQEPTYYAHYIKAKDAKKNKLKVFDTMKLGTGQGPCGYLKAKRPITPFKSTGDFVVAVQTAKKFEPEGLGLLGAVVTAKAKKK